MRTDSEEVDIGLKKAPVGRWGCSVFAACVNSQLFAENAANNKPMMQKSSALK